MSLFVFATLRVAALLRTFFQKVLFRRGGRKPLGTDSVGRGDPRGTEENFVFLYYGIFSYALILSVVVIR